MVNDSESHVILKQALSEANEMFHSLVEESLVGVYIHRDGRFIYVNPRFAKMFGYSTEEILNMDLMEIIHPESRLSVQESIRKRISGEIQKVRYIIKGLKKDGTVIHIEVHATKIVYQGLSAIIGTMVDITKQVIIQGRIEESEQRFRSLFEYNTDGVFSFDLQGKFLTANTACGKITGYPIQELLDLSFVPLVILDDLGTMLHHFEQAKHGEPQNYEVTIIRKDMTHARLNIIHFPMVVDKKIVGVYGIAKDITEWKEAEEKIRHLAYYDSLTNLPNRRLFIDRLTQALHHAKRYNHLMAVLYLDLDRFKLINDSYGHGYGDRLLDVVGKRLKNCLREIDTVARMGGDEFTVLLPDISEPEEAVQIAKRIIQLLQRPILIDGIELNTTTCIGVAFNFNDCEDADTIMKHADTAMYFVKKNGKNNYEIYTEEMDNQALYRLKLENDLRKSIERSELQLHYQPIIGLESGQIVGMEALVRWQHPEYDWISPNEFIPIAEESGLIIQIGQWVLHTACLQNKKWQKEGLPPIRMAVNLSIRQLQQKDFSKMIVEILNETKLDAAWLELEVTESIIMQNQAVVTQTLNDLRELGIKISIDDFGTGYSSLSYLRDLPIDNIKIDRVFVEDINKHLNGGAIASAVITLAHNLSMGVVAEGVETEGQLDFLQHWNCDKMQGYYFSPPVTGMSFEKLLVEGKSLKVSLDK